MYFVGIFLAQKVDDDGLVIFANEFERKGEIDGTAKVGDEQLQAVDEIVDDKVLPRFRRHFSTIINRVFLIKSSGLRRQLSATYSFSVFISDSLENAFFSLTRWKSKR